MGVVSLPPLLVCVCVCVCVCVRVCVCVHVCVVCQYINTHTNIYISICIYTFLSLFRWLACWMCVWVSPPSLSTLRCLHNSQLKLHPSRMHVSTKSDKPKSSSECTTFFSFNFFLFLHHPEWEPIRNAIRPEQRQGYRPGSPSEYATIRQDTPALPILLPLVVAAPSEGGGGAGEWEKKRCYVLIALYRVAKLRGLHDG